jgi:hypothetical protein
LERLDLQGAKVTNEGVSYLIRISSLKQLDLGRTGISRKRYEQLLKALPGCTVIGGIQVAPESEQPQGPTPPDQVL